METMDKMLNLVKQIESISEAGLHFACNDYDKERFEQLQNISLEMTSLLLNRPLVTLREEMVEKSGYKTPKVDVRAIVQNEKKEILMVREKFDGYWSLPGGWADIGLTIKENVVKEVMEEAGIPVTAIRILSVLDKKLYPHPRDIYYVYKVFIECQAQNFDIKPGMETLEVGFFPVEALPPLSLPRNLESQILLALSQLEKSSVYFD